MKLTVLFNKFKSFDDIPKEGVFLGYGITYGTKSYLSGEWFIFSYSTLNTKFISNDGYGIDKLEYWCHLPNDIKNIRLNKIKKVLSNE